MSTPPIPAATVILLRPASAGFEVLLLLKSSKVSFASSEWVYPGGKIDAADQQDNNPLQAAKRAAARESHEEAGLVLDPDQFIPISHWTTPPQKPKRFSTWLLLGVLEQEQQITIDQSEIVDHQWLSPARALQLHRQGELPMMAATFHTLLLLESCTDLAEVKQSFAQRTLEEFVPNYLIHDNGHTIFLTGDSGYAESDLSAAPPHHRMTRKQGVWDYVRT